MPAGIDPRPAQDARSLFFGPEISGGLLPEAAQTPAREALERKDEHGAIAGPSRTVHKHVSSGPLMRVAVRRNLKPREADKLKNTRPYTALTSLNVDEWLSESKLPSNPLPRLQRRTLPMPSNVSMAGVAPMLINESRPAA